MSRARVAVLQVVSNQLSVTDAAAAHGLSRRHLQRLLARYRDGGVDALEPRSRRPKTHPTQTAETVRARVVELRTELTADGADAGPHTIAWHLEQEGLSAPAASTINRILTRAGLVEAQPRKRPRSSYTRFEAAQPNETWQSDVTHWRLADGSDAEILNWLDDHSRYLLQSTVHRPATGDDVVTTFLAAVDAHGAPASTLTDNGRIYTARFGGGRNAFEYLLPILGVRQKNGSPGHPQTQGKIERFHQTQKRWLTAQPRAATPLELRRQLERFTEHYNERRPHRALARRTPADAYRATPKALPATSRPPGHYRLRCDRLDPAGRMTFRRAGQMHHLATGKTHARKRVLAIADDTTVTVTDLSTGELLSVHQIDPDRSYWRNQNKPPGRWPTTST